MSSAAQTIQAARGQVEAVLGPAAPVTRPQAKRNATTLAGRIDHTLLKPDATQDAIEQVCDEAAEHGFASVCVNSRWVPLVSARLAGRAMTCTVVGFPLGAMSAKAKAAETAIAVADGADEVDMVIDIGALRSGDLRAVYDDIRGVVEAADGRPVKVILETCLLDDEQKAIGCLLAARAGAAYVKTSTGFSTGGASVDDIALMREAVGDELGVKASGGVRTRADAEAMIGAGADRIGASASIAIASGADSSGSGY